MGVGVLAASQVVIAGGVGELSFGPGRAYERWAVNRVSVVVTGSTDEPACVISKGSANGDRLASTDAGASDDADFSPAVDLEPGDRLTVRWTGATNGAIAGATVWGTR